LKFFHLLSPFYLVLLTECHSYGLWQKCLILYLVALANLRHHQLCRMRESRLVSESASAAMALSLDRPIKIAPPWKPN